MYLLIHYSLDLKPATSCLLHFFLFSPYRGVTHAHIWLSVSLFALACSSQHIKPDGYKLLIQPNRHIATHTYRHSPCFCLQEYIGVKPNCLGDMMGAFAKTRHGLSGSFVNPLFLFFKVLFSFSFSFLYSMIFSYLFSTSEGFRRVQG